MTTTATFRPANTQELVRQLRPMDVLAISGGRIVRRETGITLPVGHGYSVTIDLAGNDTYTIRRVFTRSGVARIKGEESGIYCDQLSDTSYRASCYVNVEFGS